MTDIVQTWQAEGNADAVKLLLTFREKALAAGPDVTEHVTKSMIAWKQKRTFASAYVKGRYLEVAIDLLRAVEHDRLRAAFATTKTVTTHRFTLAKGHKVDARITRWLREAYETVGPGTRRRQTPT